MNLSSHPLPLGLLFSISVPGDGAVGTGLPAGVTAGLGIGVGIGLGTVVAIGVGIGVACGEAAARVDTPLHRVRLIAQAASAAVKARGIAFIIHPPRKCRYPYRFPALHASSPSKPRIARLAN